VELPYAAGIDGIDVAQRVEAMVVGADVDIVDVEQDEAVRPLGDRTEKFPLRHGRLREGNVA
jgi:hypothetical protein